MENLEEIIDNANFCLNCKPKPCTNGCPLGNNIPDFIGCIKKKDYNGAFDVLKETTVLAPICGRICPHEKQCQGNCVRGIKGEAVQIGKLEACVGDLAIEKGYSLGGIAGFNSNNAQKRIAVVGSGPAGLTCAAFLAQRGYKVTIYEKHDKLGGLLRYGIPEFRLDRVILDAQIQKILSLGIEVVCGKALGREYSLDDLKADYDAVFLAFGANISKKMNITGEELNGVFRCK